MYKKIMLFLMVFCLFAVSAIAIDSCNYSTTSTSSALTNVYFNTSKVLSTFDGDARYNSLSSIQTLVNWNMINYCQNSSIATNATLMINDSTYSPLWPDINISAISIRNATNNLDIGSGNYTYNITSQLIWFNFSKGQSPRFNGSNAYICYNKTFIANSTDLTNTSYPVVYNIVGGATWGSTVYFDIITTPAGAGGLALNDTNWTVGYTQKLRTCEARDAARLTRNVIFAGFALVALLAIVVSAFLIINIFQGGEVSFAGIMTAVGLIGLAVILFVGYYIIGYFVTIT